MQLNLKHKLRLTHLFSHTGGQLRLQSQQGQMLVILLLVMVVGLTIGLFLMGRTTTDISLTSKISDSSRAFNAAEAGIEDAIRAQGTIPAGTPVPVATGVSYTLSTADLGTGTIYPESKSEALAVGKAFTVWLIRHTASGDLESPPYSDTYRINTLTLCFDSSGATGAAVGVTAIYRDNAGVEQSAYAGYDPVAGRRGGNGFLATDPTPSQCAGYTTQATLNFANHFGIQGVNPPVSATLVALRLRPVYTATSLAVRPLGGETLPTQGNEIDSTGTAGETVRKIEVEEPYKIPAPFMDQVLYSKDANSDLRK